MLLLLITLVRNMIADSLKGIAHGNIQPLHMINAELHNQWKTHYPDSYDDIRDYSFSQVSGVALTLTGDIEKLVYEFQCKSELCLQDSPERVNKLVNDSKP